MKQALYKGPDISKHNGNVNIKKVRDAGYKRIGIRAGYGKNNVDEKYVSNALACVNLGVLAIIYWFSYAFSELMARNEGDYCCDQVEKYWEKCPVAYDCEYDTVRYARTKGVNITKELATNMAIAFLSRVKERGHVPVIYTNRDYLKNYFDMDKIVAALELCLESVASVISIFFIQTLKWCQYRRSVRKYVTLTSRTSNVPQMLTVTGMQRGESWPKMAKMVPILSM